MSTVAVEVARHMLPDTLWNEDRASVPDVANRQKLTKNELYYDSPPPSAARDNGSSSTLRLSLRSRPMWFIRFKELVRPDRTSWDPWWMGDKARKMVFTPVRR